MNSPNHNKSTSQMPNTLDTQSQEDSKLKTGSMSLGKAVSQAKKAKQEAVMNAQLLANRIALLQHEEAKMVCKINETRKKTFELYKVKKNNEEWKSLKSKSKNHEDQRTKETQNCSQKYREQHEELRQKIRDSLLSQKQKEAMEIRNERKRNEMRIKQTYEGSSIENKRKSTRIKAGIFQGKLKIKDYVNSRSSIFKQEKMDLIMHDELTVKQKELEMARMELLEMELIKKLQNTHEVQKSIYEEYDSLLNESIQEFEKKFEPPQNKKYQVVDYKGPKGYHSQKNRPWKNDKLVKTPQALGMLAKKKTLEVTKGSEVKTEKKEESPASPIKENFNSSP